MRAPKPKQNDRPLFRDGKYEVIRIGAANHIGFSDGKKVVVADLAGWFALGEKQMLRQKLRIVK